jgi:uncharacterized protein (TIGR03437 family)
MNRLYFFIHISSAGLAVVGRGAVPNVEQPIGFERNQGQTDPSVKFLARAGNYRLFLTDSQAVLAFDGKRPVSLVIRPLGANRAPKMIELEEQRGISNYLTGADPDKWVTGVKHYSKVRYQQIYPGVDLMYYATERQLEHDFIVGPGADYRNIRLRYEGASTIRLERNGDLVMRTPDGEVRQLRPVIYQDISGERRLIAGGYRMNGGEVSFRVGAYDPSLPLVIDPVIFSTYLSGNGIDQPVSIAVDARGAAYATGMTTSLNFPVKNALQSKIAGGTDVFVTKLDGASGAVLFSTYLGGSANDVASQIKVDATGSAYVVGSTSSTDFPTTKGAFQTTLLGPLGAFIIKLNAAGNGLIYGTFLSGSQGAIGRGLDVDPTGSVYVVGATASRDFPVKGFGLSLTFGIDGFLTKLSADGSSLIYSNYLGGNGSDCLEGVAVNSIGEANIAGWTSSTDLPTSFEGSRWPTLAGVINGFMAKVSASGFQVEYISYYGGSLVDIASSILVDPSDVFTVYIGGLASSPDFPTTDAPLTLAQGGMLPYVAKFALPNALGEEARSPVRAAAQVDDYSWFTPAPDQCQGTDWGPLMDSLKKDQKDLTEIEELALVSGVGFVNGTAGTALGGLIVIKHIMEPCSSSGKAKPGPVSLASPTQAPGPLFAMSAVDGSPINVLEPPLSTTGTISVRAFATDPSGNIYVAVQTSDPTLPVSASGLPAGSGAAGGTGYIARLGAAQSGSPIITKVANAEGGESTVIAPNTWVEIKGSGLAPAGISSPACAPGYCWQAADFLNNQLPTVLQGVSVSMNGLPAYVYFISSGQINVLTPPNLATGQFTVQVTVSGVPSAAFSSQAQAESISFFVLSGGPYVLATHLDGSLIGPSSLFPGATTPAKPGEQIVFYTNGYGPTNPPAIAGSLTQAGNLPTLPQLTIGGFGANVSFAGLISPGLYQFNVTVPTTLPDGDSSVQSQYAGQLTPAAALITIKH